MMSPTDEPSAIAFDVFGTLVDPGGLTQALELQLGEAAAGFAAEWRRTQVEYLLRHAAMGTHRPFSAVTAAALIDCLARAGIALEPSEREALLDQWWRLPAFPDAGVTLQAVAAAGYSVVAFSNGESERVDELLRTAGLRAPLSAVHGVAAAGTYKPAPVVYRQLTRSLGIDAGRVWLVSANYWDALGASAAGLRSVWIARGRPVESWDWQPDVMVDELAGLQSHPLLVPPKP